MTIKVEIVLSVIRVRGIFTRSPAISGGISQGLSFKLDDQGSPCVIEFFSVKFSLSSASVSENLSKGLEAEQMTM